MKKHTLIIFILLFVNISFGQKVKLVVKYFNNSKQISESYTVLKENKNIRHGEYISYFLMTRGEENEVKNGSMPIENFIKKKGNYVDGKKEGDWIEYLDQNKFDSGAYLNNKKVGIWHTIYNKREIASFDYDENKKVGIWLTYRENGDIIERYDYDSGVALEPSIRFDIKYPPIAKEKGVQGQVSVQYHLNKDCSIVDIKITQSLSPECDQAVIDAITKYSILNQKYNSGCKETDEQKEFNFKLE